jgi:RimJ/RimL family protein N-acetyltransferase
MEKLIKIRAFNDDDMVLFTKWLYTPHVAKWYHEPTDWIKEIEKRTSEFIWVHHFIVEFNDKPIGFCQYYEYKNSGETWHGDVDMEGTYSIDYMIGDADYLGIGLGKQIIKSLIDKIKLYNNAKCIIVQPEPENLASCKTLLSCDFIFDKRNEIYVLELGNSNALIRPIIKAEVSLLTDFLYEAIFQRENEPRLSRTVLQEPAIWIYIDNFGTKKDDHCLVAEIDGKIVGAIWVRCMKAYGFIDDDTPEIAMSVYAEYRGKGIGTKLLKEMLKFLNEKGYKQVSLSVEKDNYAAKMYNNFGFSVIKEKENDYLMLHRLT